MEDLTLAWIFIGCGVWAVLMGAMLISCLAEDITEADYYALENEQWQRDQDDLERDGLTDLLFNISPNDVPWKGRGSKQLDIDHNTLEKISLKNI